MTRCFVIQPFDAGKFDKRFGDVYAPAIRDAGLEPYRVDQDASADVPIDAIEDGIRNSSACLADITTDNPNVWYELGFAFASNRPVVMICAEERTGKKYPFDIQHRTIVPYKTESPQDFETLRAAITKRLKAVLSKDRALEQIGRNDRLAEIGGLSQPELIVLAAAAGNVVLPNTGTSVYILRNDVERNGFTNLGFALGLRRLLAKHMVTLEEDTDYNGETFQVVLLTPSAWDWIEQNEDKFVIKKQEPDSNDPF